MTAYERRDFAEPVEVRQEGNKLVAYGYAARFNTRSQNLGGFVEQVAPGAFAQTITQQDIRGLFNHSEDYVLGRMASGTLRLAEDEIGLGYEIDLPDTTTGRDLATLLERGDVSGSSFGFRTIGDDWGETESGFPLRTLTAVSLRDVGPVTFPAYLDAESGLRSAALASFAEARSLPFDVVALAAKSGDLRAAIPPTEAEDDGAETTTEVDDGSGRATPTATVIRHPVAY